MGEKQNLEEQLFDIQNQLAYTLTLRDEIWNYHPSNPGFVNPITLFERIKSEIKDLECKINDIEFKINSLN